MKCGRVVPICTTFGIGCARTLATHTQDDMSITFDDNEVNFVLDEDATGPSTAFIAGQTTEKGECSLGCHDNFYQFNGRKIKDAVNVDVTTFKGDADADLKETDETPCGKHIVPTLN